MNLISQTHERMQAPGNKVRKRISTFQYSRNDKKVKRGKRGKRRKAKGKNKTRKGVKTDEGKLTAHCSPWKDNGKLLGPKEKHASKRAR
jgi:hypothetical protein